MAFPLSMPPWTIARPAAFRGFLMMSGAPATGAAPRRRGRRGV
ncbi:MAG: hypothetical protein RLZZ127_2459, partial [Planctomycetota bacterium]